MSGLVAKIERLKFNDGCEVRMLKGDQQGGWEEVALVQKIFLECEGRSCVYLGFVDVTSRMLYLKLLAFLVFDLIFVTEKDTQLSWVSIL